MFSPSNIFPMIWNTRFVKVLFRSLEIQLNKILLYLPQTSGGYSGTLLTLASHLWDQSLNPGLTSCGKAWSCLLLVGSLQYRTLTNCMYWFSLPFQGSIRGQKAPFCYFLLLLLIQSYIFNKMQNLYGL